jgi:hypothetical protein
LMLEYTKGGTTNQRFPMEQYLAYFDYDTLKQKKLKSFVL